MITHSRLAEVRKKLFGRKLAKRPKPPNEAERLYLGAMRTWADSFRAIILGAIARTYPELAGTRQDGSPDQPRDENGRWTGGGDSSRAGVSAAGKPLKPRAFEWTTPAGVTHRFTDKPGERDTYEFKQAYRLIREGEAKERMYAAISEHATEHPGFDYHGANFKKDKENPGNFRITHEHNELGINAERDIFEPGGSYRRADGTRHDALRIGPLMLGKKASKVLQGITNPLREAADRVPLSQVGGTVRSHVEHDVPRYMPGLANTDLFLGSEIAAWRNENVDLITDLSDEMLDRIGDLLEDYDGTRVEEIASALEDIFGMTRARAELIARDQTLKLNGRMNQAAQTAAGVERYRWSTSNDGSVRNDPKDRGDPNHEILNNTVHRWDDPPVTCERTGATNHPGQDYQCRCIAIPVLEEFDDEPTQVESVELDGGDFDESKHPRDEKGQFSETEGDSESEPAPDSIQESGDVTEDYDTVYWRLQNEGFSLSASHRSQSWGEEDGSAPVTHEGTSAIEGLKLAGAQANIDEMHSTHVEAVAFKGEEVGRGADGEPIVIPAKELARYRIEMPKSKFSNTRQLARVSFPKKLSEFESLGWEKVETKDVLP